MLDAKPFHAFPGDPTFEEAFQDAWVFFSHFVKLCNKETYNLNVATEVQKRGAAIVTWQCQYNIDGGIPVHFGNPDITEIDESTTTILQMQVKNCGKAIRLLLDPTLLGSNASNLPVISMGMHLGVEKEEGYRVEVTSEAKGGMALSTRAGHKSRPEDINRRHYMFTLYGCTSKTYACIPEPSPYKAILRAIKPFDNLPRMESDANREAVHALKLFSDYDKNHPSCIPWS
jgi:hypothetical protein